MVLSGSLRGSSNILIFLIFRISTLLHSTMFILWVRCLGGVIKGPFLYFMLVFVKCFVKTYLKNFRKISNVKICMFSIYIYVCLFYDCFFYMISMFRRGHTQLLLWFYKSFRSADLSTDCFYIFLHLAFSMHFSA